MREPPKLADATIMAALEANYGIPISALSFLPIGADAASSGYRVQAVDGAAYFLKVRARHGFSPRSLLVPRYLHDAGVHHILPALPTNARALWVPVNDFALSLFPFVEGRRAADAGLSSQQWIELGSTVKQIQASQLPSDLRPIVPRERFTPTRREVLTQLEAEIGRPAYSDAVQGELAEFWNSRREEIRALVDRADRLARQLRVESPPLVLCHADLHAWNMLIDFDEDLWLVDWDETVLALKERDLMFVMGGIGRDLVSPHETASFLQGYGEAEIDPRALAYYRYAWAVQDMGAYAEQVFFSGGLVEESRRDAYKGFVDMFEPGNIVDIAFESDGAQV
jgi:spectinomycin phosphotransferase